MNIAGELAGSGSIKNWLHKSLNTQKRATSGPFLYMLEKRLSGKTFQRPDLIPKHFNFCIYLFIIPYLNERKKKAKVLVFMCVESDKRDDKIRNSRTRNMTRNYWTEGVHQSNRWRIVRSKAIWTQSFARWGKVPKTEKPYILLQTRCGTWSRHEQIQDKEKFILK